MENLDLVWIETDVARASVSPHGGYVVNWQVKNSAGKWVEVLYQGESLKRSGIPVLFPFAGPLKNETFNLVGSSMSQHGFGRLVDWKVAKISQETVELSLFSEFLPEQWRVGYPYDFEVKITVNIDGKLLKYGLLVSNQSDSKDMPICPGIHPYFHVKHDDKPSLSLSLAPEFDSTAINWDTWTDYVSFDFDSGQTDVLLHEKSILEIAARSSFGQNNQLIVWSGMGAADFVCIEPITKPFNALNDNPIIVLPDSKWQWDVAFTKKDV